MNRMRAGLVAALLGSALFVPLHFFRSYPQPVLFGDPAGYWRVGERLQEAVGRLRAGEDPCVVFESVRGVFYLLGVGVFFAATDGLRPQDWGFVRVVLAGFNTLALLGAFLLARRLAGSFAAGVVALAVGVVYPSFSVQTGRLYPDPITGCLFVWAAWLYLEAVVRRSTRFMVAAALVFTTGLLVRAQIMNYMLLVLALVLAATAPVWVRRRESRRLALAFMLACLPAGLAWAGIVRAVGERDDVIQLGNSTFKPYYPYGFWQFLETDGWIGPYRVKTEPYYKAMEAEARGDPDLLRSRAKQVAFTVRYVMKRPWESLLLVLDNVYRLYDRPANDYKWDYPLPYPWQVALQRGVVVLALAGLVVFAAERRAVAGVFLVPVSLAVLHGLVFPWPRYNLPAMPILIAAASAAAVRLAPAGWRLLRRAPEFEWMPLVGLVGGLILFVSAHLLGVRLPEAARFARWLGTVLVLAVPFLLAPRRARRFAVAVWAVLAVLVTAHALRDRLWHQLLTEVPAGTGVEQEILLTPEALGTLRAAREAFLVFDLRVPQGDLSRTMLEVNGQALPGSSLLPTMPRLRESTSTGGRDWRGYPQWWALPLDIRMLPDSATEPLRVRLLHDGRSPLVLGGDRFRWQQRLYEGPSLGDWPHFVALKLEYDGDYRIAVRLPLGSVGTRSFLIQPGGQRRDYGGVHRIRLITLRANEGELLWESAPFPASASRVALGFAAFSGNRGSAEMLVDGVPALSFPLGGREDFQVEAGSHRLCYRAEEPRQDKPYGSYFLFGPRGRPGAPVTLAVRFRTGMSAEPMFFVVDRRRDFAQTAAAFARCAPEPGTTLIDGGARLLDATRNVYPTDTGRWAVARVF